MERRVALEGCLNFRDLGGYPVAGGGRVRWRQVFRSDALDRLTDTDVARLRDDIGLTTVVDLRSRAERLTDPEDRLAALAHHHVPLFDADVIPSDARTAAITLADRYWLLAEFAKERIVRVLDTLAAAPGPAVYHCAAGKDRTGVISAVLLGVLGVPDDVIVSDYVATQEHLDAIIDRLMATEGYQTVLATLPPDTLHAEGETMLAFLARVREAYGSLTDYAVAAGLAPDALATLRGRLLE